MYSRLVKFHGAPSMLKVATWLATATTWSSTTLRMRASRIASARFALFHSRKTTVTRVGAEPPYRTSACFTNPGGKCYAYR